ncbi:hypothetical protein F4808DRAFT_354128 [Astrocystis sublimbata]|nr:hypothetical protein F4808DRAFT_354128 [Astrocystis sublimbata]
MAVLFFLALLALVNAQGEATCYDAAGLQKDFMFACNSSAEVSVCCSQSDYCLDNGLCLDALGDNIFTVQGCTSKAWDAPCQKYCEDENLSLNSYQGLTLCESTAHKFGQYCCGQDASCCSKSDSSSWITLPIFMKVFKPSGIANSSPMCMSSVPEPSTSTALTMPNETKIAIGLAIALGVPLLIESVIVVVLFARWGPRRLLNELTQKHETQKQERPVEAHVPVSSNEDNSVWAQRGSFRLAQELPDTIDGGELASDNNLSSYAKREAYHGYSQGF